MPSLVWFSPRRSDRRRSRARRARSQPRLHDLRREAPARSALRSSRDPPARAHAAVRAHRSAERRHVDPARRRSRDLARGSVGPDPARAAPHRRAVPARAGDARGDHDPRVVRRRAAPGDQGRGADRRAHRAAPAQRADRGRARSRRASRRRSALPRVRPRRRHVRRRRWSTSTTACSRCSRPPAIRSSAATISIARSSSTSCATCARRAASTSRRDAIAIERLRLAAQRTKHELSDRPTTRLAIDRARAAAVGQRRRVQPHRAPRRARAVGLAARQADRGAGHRSARARRPHARRTSKRCCSSAARRGCRRCARSSRA